MAELARFQEQLAKKEAPCRRRGLRHKLNCPNETLIFLFLSPKGMTIVGAYVYGGRFFEITQKLENMKLTNNHYDNMKEHSYSNIIITYMKSRGGWLVPTDCISVRRLGGQWRWITNLLGDGGGFRSSRLASGGVRKWRR
ncbi:Uncharacterized protein Fot_05861 [Forsythia ovata]|uniref:Uncharacterized protein n=1 Tax=Forsythia ovata TaxID=205694 RepID=A0ABD1WRP6_9LAMI